MNWLKRSKLYWLFSLAAAAAVLLSACSRAEIADTGAQAPVDENEALVRTSNHPEYGEILVDGEGRTLYLFTVDGPDQSNCIGDCLLNWPPLTTTGNPQAGPGVNAEMLGSTSLEDGSLITTYNGRPLYYWAADSQPGQASGQGVGGVWFVVSPQGEPVGQ
jgi:predicted lipoprotein with Yx(FWY)xxD motif